RMATLRPVNCAIRLHSSFVKCKLLICNLHSLCETARPGPLRVGFPTRGIMAVLMCGIAGYCGPVRRFDEAKLGLMLRAIEHRGPDDCGVFSAPADERGENGVWLGSRRL